MIEPIAIAPCIPCIPASPVSLRTKVATSNVAIAIPDTGLLLLPTRPTILDDTVAKKKPNITIIIAPTNVTGIAGINQIATVSARILIRIIFILKSFAVRDVSVLAPFFIPLMASLNVLMISGSDLTRLIIPPAANAPAPIYLI